MNPAVPRHRSATHCANVDLDIFSRVALDGLVQAMGDAVLVLYVGGEAGSYEAHVELASSHKVTADRTIRGLIRLIEGLPPRYRRLWDRARSREFNAGIEAGLDPHAFELRLERRTLEAIAAVNGTLVITVYAPDLPQARTRRSKKRPKERQS